MSRLALYLLGPPRLELDGELVHIGQRQAVALLAYLAVTGEHQRRDSLATLLWPEYDQSRARADLRRTLSLLDRMLGDEWIAADRETAGLRQAQPEGSGPDLWLDVSEFRQRLATCEMHGHAASVDCPDCLALLAEAVALYQDDFMAGFTLPDSPAFDEWQRFQTEGLRGALASALERLVGCHGARGEYESAIAYARRWLELDSTHEPAHRRLMELYAQAGRRADALRQYRMCVRLLEQQLSVAPSAETTALFGQIQAERVPEKDRHAKKDLVLRTIRDYELRERIGSGGFGEVYRAYQPSVRREVAIKVILPQFASHPEFVDRFETEAQLVARLEHLHIVPLYDYWRESEGAYLVMRWLRGGNLGQSLQRGPWTLRAASRLLDQIADALMVAHRQGVVHRDVKPENIMLDQEGNAYLTDFGIAKDLLRATGTTGPDAVPGSLAYISPEQAQSRPVTPQSDIYSLGVVMYEVLIGEHPFPGLTPGEQLVRQLTEPMPPLQERRPDLPAALDAVIQRATAKDPDERYPNALAFSAAFGKAVSGAVAEAVAPAPVSGMPAPPPVAPAWYRQPRVWAALGLILALMLAGTAILRSWLFDTEEPHGLARAVPTAQPGEAMILIAQFKAQEGSEYFDVSQRIYNKLSDDLRQLGEMDASVYQVPKVIESSAEAITLGQRYGAMTVIWGFYDDLGISPNVEAVGLQEDNLLSVGLERLNLNSAEAVSFRLYVAKELPEEVSFLTAVSLFQAFALQGDWEKAMRYVDLAEQNLPTDPQFRGGGEMVFFVKAMMAGLRGNAEQVVEHLTQAISINPNEAFFYIFRGWVYVQLEKADEALADLERAITLGPGDELAPTTYLYKGIAHWRAGDFEAALHTFGQIIELDPDDLTPYYAQAWIGAEMGDLTLALAALEHVEERFPEHGFLLICRGLVYERMGREEQAAADYAQALDFTVAPDGSVQFMKTLGLQRIPAFSYLFECATYQAQGKIERALVSCNKALEAEPAHFDTLWKRGQLHAAQGDVESAVADYTAAIAADPGWPWVYYLRARALAALGQAEEAQSDLALALELNPVDTLREQIEALQTDIP